MANNQELDRLLQEYTEKAFTVNYLVQKHQSEIDELQSQIDACVEKIQNIVGSDAAIMNEITSSFILANGVVTRENSWQYDYCIQSEAEQQPV